MDQRVFFFSISLLSLSYSSVFLFSFGITIRHSDAQGQICFPAFETVSWWCSQSTIRVDDFLDEDFTCQSFSFHITGSRMAVTVAANDVAGSLSAAVTLAAIVVARGLYRLNYEGINI